ncbi:MAG TPA: MFS transporter [Geminicoccus sp.]|uniref:MFS transporter n=1 Tax=Geminicoccus sp. TaxID=2024832 RepID=UPI002E30268E|nr:MFS transporter [Geminicoccus sp.]HEX2525310.1 MFS transporter [Geminicoccus sp.]
MARHLVFVVILMASVFAMAQGLSYPLLAFILERQGVSPAIIGLNTAMTPLGIIASAAFIPWIAKRMGAANMALVSALMLAGLLAIIGAWQVLPVWFPARFMIGVAINGLFISSETWVNLLAPEGKRGRLLGLFSSSLAAGFAIGPFIIVATGTLGWAPFLVGIAVFLTTAFILFLARKHLPPLHGEEAVSVRNFLPLAPFLLLSVVTAAAFDQGSLALLPPYGRAFGVGEATMAAAIGVLIIGNIVFQMPIGWLADRWSRRGTTMLLCGLTVIGAALLPFAIGTNWATWALFFFWGSTAYGIYTVALIELGDRFNGSILLAGNASFALMWGIGGMIGPPAFGAAMTSLGPHGLPLMMGLLYAALILIGLLRMRQRVPA